MAFLVENEVTYLTLVALLTETPNEMITMRTKCRLLKSSLSEIVAVDLINASFPGASRLKL